VTFAGRFGHHAGINLPAKVQSRAKRGMLGSKFALRWLAPPIHYPLPEKSLVDHHRSVHFLGQRSSVGRAADL
jgi:hypothetical protein